MTVKFNLRKLKGVHRSAVMVEFTQGRIRKRLHTALHLPAMFWDNKNECAITENNPDAAEDFNRRMDLLKSTVKKSIARNTESMETMVLNVAQIFEAIEKDLAILDIGRNYDDFWFQFNAFVLFKKERNSNYIFKDYHNSLRKHLKAIEERRGKPLTVTDFKRAPNNAYEDFYSYLVYEAPHPSGRKGLMQNTVDKNVKNLKAFLNYCFDNDIYKPFSLKYMERKNEVSDEVYLTEEELTRIHKLELRGKEALVRDVFLIGVAVGQRFVDYCQLNQGNIQEDNFIIHQKKTKRRVVVPISKRARKIIDSYDGEIPTYSGDVTPFNNTLREVIKKAGIDEPITSYFTLYNERQSVTKEKWEMISSHTARRTFCTLMFLKDMPVPAIMKISGHTSYNSFMRYLKVDSEMVANKFRDFFD